MVYPFLPVFMSGLNADFTMLSLALTLRAAMGVFAPFFASLSDIKGRTTGMVTGIGVFILGMCLLIPWPTFTAFVGMLILSILGNLIFIPSMQAYLGDRIPFKRLGLVLGLSEVGWSLSFIIGVPLMGLLIARYGWKAPFPILGGMGLLALLMLLAALPKEDTSSAKARGIRDNFRSIFSYPPAIAGIIAGMAMSASNELINVTFGVWMEQAFNVQIAVLAITSAIIGSAELGGELLVSVLSDRIGKQRSTALGLILNTAAALCLPWVGLRLNGAFVGLFLVFITFEFTIVSSIPMMTAMLPSARATLMACFIASLALGRALGAYSAPFLFRTGNASASLPGMVFVCLAAGAMNLVAFSLWRFTKPFSTEGAAAPPF